MNDCDVSVAVNEQTWDGIGVTVNDAIRGQVRPRSQRRALEDRVNDTRLPGD
jgi:hypothetical protein